MIGYTQKHIIQRVIVEVEINSEYNTDYLHSENWLNIVRDWVYSTLLPMLEEIFDKLSLPHEMIRLDQLQLELRDLSEVHLKNLTNEAHIHIQQLIEKKVKAVQVDSEFKRLSEGQNTVQAFLFFLKTGRLPWWFMPQPLLEWESQILTAFAEYPMNLTLVFKDTAVCQRLIGHFSDAFFEEIIRKISFRFYEKTVELHGVIGELMAVANLSPSKKEKVNYTVKQILLRFFGQDLSIEQLPIYVINHLPEKQFSVLQKAAFAFANVKSEEKKHFLQLLTINGQRKKAFFGESQEVRLNEEAPEENATIEEIYIANAGLVLLHPFIEYLFEELKISRNGKLLNPQRATYLLQWLVSGQFNAPEYELPLNKLLCGMSPKAPVIEKFKLTKREKEETQQLLEAVIRHWAVLKNTSPAGLQANFLCREGKLTQKPDGDWLLQIERKSIDILLADLPWSISMIQLPWMSHFLWVEWE